MILFFIISLKSLFPEKYNSSSMEASNGNVKSTIKFLCSFGGIIRPRYPDGERRYHGGDTRVLAVHRSISFSGLLVKLGEMCGRSVSLRCQLPTEDLDALVSVTSDEDLANLVEEYDRAASISPSSYLKIRAFLFHSPPKSVKRICPPPPPPSNSPSHAAVASASNFPAPPIVVPLCFDKSAGIFPHCAYPVIPNQMSLIHKRNHWQ